MYFVANSQSSRGAGLAEEAHPHIPLGYVATVCSPGGSDLCYNLHSAMQSLAQCVLIGEKQVVLCISLSGELVTLGDALTLIALLELGG